MSRVIWKYQLSHVMPDKNVLSVPRGGVVVHVGTQNELVFVWVLVWADAPLVDRVLAVYATGQPLAGAGGEYVGTVQQTLIPKPVIPPFHPAMRAVELVWHVFDLGESEPTQDELG